MTTDQMALTSADPRVMHSQPVIAGTRVPVSVILDCLAADMTAEEIVADTRRSPLRACTRLPDMGVRHPHLQSCPVPV